MTTDQPQPEHPAVPQSGPSAREHQLKAALTAFEKRYKLTKLNDESKLSGKRALTGGKQSDLAGIVPPREFPPDVWAELAKQGKIKDMGGGFYGVV